MLFGHDDKIKTFKKLISENRLSHAYLFYGYPQIGKFHFASAFAYFLEYGEFDLPADGDKPLLDAKILLPDEKGVIGIDSVRALKFFLSKRPIKSPRRLVIVNDAEALTPEAQSALLKIVEEPPSSATIIFIAHDSQILFAPLRSRLTSLYFRPLSKSALEQILIKRYELSPTQAGDIIKKSFGRFGRAIDLIRTKRREGSVEGDEDLLKSLEKKIIDLYIKGVTYNSKIISKLLSREVVLRRFNLNQNIQRKAVEYLVS